MAGVSADQTAHVMEFFDLVVTCVKDNTLHTTEAQANNVGLALLTQMANAGIGLTFPEKTREGRIDQVDKPLF